MSETCKDKNLSVLLHAYELGMLSEEEKDAFEAHLLECSYCFEQLKEFAPRGTTLAVSPGIRKVLDEIHRRPPGEESLARRIWGMLWPKGLPVVVKPAVLLCVLLLMIYPARLGMRDFGERDIATVQEIALLQARSSETFVVAPGQDVVLSFLCPESAPGKTYTVTLSDYSGTVIYHQDTYTYYDSYGVGRLLLSDKYIAKGTYRLAVWKDDRTTDERPDAEYIFHIVYPPPSK